MPNLYSLLFLSFAIAGSGLHSHLTYYSLYKHGSISHITINYIRFKNKAYSHHIHETNQLTKENFSDQNNSCA